jgi:hypothetical protein
MGCEGLCYKTLSCCWGEDERSHGIFFVTMGENLFDPTDATVGAAEGRSRISCVSKIES